MTLEEQFYKLKHDYHTKYGHLSDSRGIESDEYKQIIEIGKQDIKILINDLNDRDGDWFHALCVITGERPNFKMFQEHLEYWKNKILDK